MTEQRPGLVLGDKRFLNHRSLYARYLKGDSWLCSKAGAHDWRQVGESLTLMQCQKCTETRKFPE